MTLNGAGQLVVADPHAGSHARLDDDLRINQPIEHITSQPTILIRIDGNGSEKRLKLLALTYIEPLKIVVANLFAIDGRNRHATVRRHILMNTP